MATYTFETDHVFSAANDFMADNGITPPVIDLSALSGNVLAAFVQRGINHVYGNVPQSAAYGAAKKLLAKQTGHDKVSVWEKSVGDAAKVRSIVRKWREENPTEAKRLAHEAIGDAHTSVVNGALMPERPAAGESYDPVTAKMRQLALDVIRKAVNGASGTLPKKHDAPTSVELPADADHDAPWNPTVNDLIARQLARKGDDFRKQAEALIAAEQRAASRMAGDTSEL